MSEQENMEISRRMTTRVAQPLQGKRILVTRTREQASALSERLSVLGAIPIEFPTIRIVPPKDWRLLDQALGKLFVVDGVVEEKLVPAPATGGHPSSPNPRPYAAPTTVPKPTLGGVPVGDDTRGTAGGHKGPHPSSPNPRPYAWVVFTSVNGVHICCERLRSRGYDLQAMGNVRIAAIGPATAAALTRYGLAADLVPGEYIAEGVATALMEDAQQRGEPLEGQRILLARAAEARKVLVTSLQQAGAIVDEVAAYYTVTVASDDEQGQQILHLLQTHQLDILTFTSSSTVRNFVQWLTSCRRGADLVTSNPQLKIACIGPITAQTARELGLDVHIAAKEFTIDGLVKAIVAGDSP